MLQTRHLHWSSCTLIRYYNSRHFCEKDAACQWECRSKMVPSPTTSYTRRNSCRSMSTRSSNQRISHSDGREWNWKIIHLSYFFMNILLFHYVLRVSLPYGLLLWTWAFSLSCLEGKMSWLIVSWSCFTQIFHFCYARDVNKHLIIIQSFLVIVYIMHGCDYDLGR